MTHLMAVILTRNECEHIAECIASVAFADSVLVFDSYSTDNTVQLAQKAGADVIQNMFNNYAQQRNDALNAARGRGADWVLFVDADERIPPELAAEIRRVIDQPQYDAWRIPRHNYIFGKLTRATGWYPDYQTRLLRIGAAYYDPERKVHEVVVLARGERALGTLTEHITHYNYKDAAHFAAKQRVYTAYEAQILYEQGIHPKFRNFILQPLRHFWWRFFTLKGYQDGLHGLRLSRLMAWYEFKKYWLLWQLWRKVHQ
ncbi:MAG: glycosyltransferase family 2 protein [Chloroflexi bacterium]|nr:MAG: glycosyltransferase family 2 protein [Chloroflexota bacterium]